MFNFERRITSKIDIEHKEGSKHVYAVNHSYAFFACKRYFRNPGKPGYNLADDIAKHKEPVRPGRKYQRKISPKKKLIPFSHRIT